MDSKCMKILLWVMIAVLIFMLCNSCNGKVFGGDNIWCGYPENPYYTNIRLNQM